MQQGWARPCLSLAGMRPPLTLDGPLGTPSSRLCLSRSRLRCQRRRWPSPTSPKATCSSRCCAAPCQRYKHLQLHTGRASMDSLQPPHTRSQRSCTVPALEALLPILGRSKTSRHSSNFSNQLCWANDHRHLAENRPTESLWRCLKQKNPVQRTTWGKYCQRSRKKLMSILRRHRQKSKTFDSLQVPLCALQDPRLENSQCLRPDEHVQEPVLFLHLERSGRWMDGGLYKPSRHRHVMFAPLSNA
mmetsp:Transcript_52697/g.112463  ORF Transcript_52697/g.112463 Transcript_52697/m.112463 type:complete len:245 (+) Transcript_52697:468-1202(+)